MQQLQVYIELIKVNREELRKKKTFEELGFSERDIERALQMDTARTQDHAQKLPAEKLRAEIAYLAEFHCHQLDKIHELEARTKNYSISKLAVEIKRHIHISYTDACVCTCIYIYYES